MLGFIIGLLLMGFIVGALARLAVPGPDPMPVWMTIAIGLAGSVAAGFVSRAFFSRGPSFILAFAFSVLLVIGYRRFVQHRPITGPGARRMP